jgi:hypothetical protein
MAPLSDLSSHWTGSTVQLYYTVTASRSITWLSNSLSDPTEHGRRAARLLQPPADYVLTPLSSSHRAFDRQPHGACWIMAPSGSFQKVGKSRITCKGWEKERYEKRQCDSRYRAIDWWHQINSEAPPVNQCYWWFILSVKINVTELKPSSANAIQKLQILIYEKNCQFKLSV